MIIESKANKITTVNIESNTNLLLLILETRISKLEEKSKQFGYKSEYLTT